MTVQFSPHKVRNILRGYFRGLPQIKIAKDVGVDQSSISHYATRFKKLAAHYGVTAAGEEYGVKNEVDSLRSLSVELYQSKLTVEDARKGSGIIKAFDKLGISPEKHLDLIQLCKKIDDPGFAYAALKLSQIEGKMHKGYQHVISDLEAASAQLQQLDKKVFDKQAELDLLNNTISQKKKEFSIQEKLFEEYKIQYKSEEAKLGKELSTKMQQLKVNMKEVEEVAELKSQLFKKGLNLETALKLAKEFGYGK